MSEPYPNSAPSRVRPAPRYALAVFLLALGARLALLMRFFASPHFGIQSSDMQFYHGWALRILQGQWTDHHAFYGLPGYAYLLAAIYKLGGVHPLTVALLQAAIDAATTTLIFCLTRLAIQSGERSTVDPRGDRPALVAAGAAALGWLCFVPAQAYAFILMPTIWLVAAYWFCVWVIVRRRNEGAVWPWIGLGLLVGVTAMLVATILFLVPLLIAAIGLQVAANEKSAKRRAKSLAAVVVLFLGVGAGAAPAWIHNYFIAKEPVFLSAHGGINFWIGNWPGANGYPNFPPEFRSGQQELLDDSIHLAERAAGHPLTRPEVSRYWSAKASAQIHEHPAVWVHLLGLKLRAFWNAFSYDDVTIIALMREEEVLLPGLGFGVAAAFGLAGLGLGLIRGGPARWVAAAVLLHVLAILPVFVTERYRLAAVPGLLILGAYGLHFLWRAIERRQVRMAGLFVAALAVSAAIVFIPNDHPDLASMEAYNLALSEMDAVDHLAASNQPLSDEAKEELDRAQRHLEVAQKLAPNNPVLLFAFGRFWTLKSEREKAKAAYQLALAADPHYGDALTNLGVIAVQEKRWNDAAQLFSRAAAENPNDPGAHYLLARAREELGDLPGALQAVEAALRLSPSPPFEALRQRLLQRQSAN